MGGVPYLPAASCFVCCSATTGLPMVPDMQLATKDGEASSKDKETLPEYVLRFHPPLVIHNFLPCPITVTLHDNRAGGQHFHQQREPITFSMSTGGYQEIYQLDMSRRIKMSVQMQVSSANGTSSICCWTTQPVGHSNGLQICKLSPVHEAGIAWHSR